MDLSELRGVEIPDLTSPKQKRLLNIARKVGAMEAAEGALIHAVRLARKDGASWAEIAMPLGMTKQGAQQKYATVVNLLG